MTAKAHPTGITEDAVLGGRLRLRQPRRGHRVGHDAILLAAACPARQAIGWSTSAPASAPPGLRSPRAFRRRPSHWSRSTHACRARDGQCAAQRSRGARARASRSTLRRRRAHSRRPASTPTAPRSVMMNPPFNDPARQRSSPDARARVWRMRRRAPPRCAGCKTATRLLRARRHAHADLAGGWARRRAGGAGAGIRAVTIVPVHPAPDKPAIRCPRSRRSRRAAHRLRCCRRWCSTTLRAGRPRRRKRCCAGRRCRATLPWARPRPWERKLSD